MGGLAVVNPSVCSRLSPRLLSPSRKVGFLTRVSVTACAVTMCCCASAAQYVLRHWHWAGLAGGEVHCDYGSLPLNHNNAKQTTWLSYDDRETYQSAQTS